MREIMMLITAWYTVGLATNVGCLIWVWALAKEHKANFKTKLSMLGVLQAIATWPTTLAETIRFTKKVIEKHKNS